MWLYYIIWRKLSSINCKVQGNLESEVSLLLKYVNLYIKQIHVCRFSSGGLWSKWQIVFSHKLQVSKYTFCVGLPWNSLWLYLLPSQKQSLGLVKNLGIRARKLKVGNREQWQSEIGLIMKPRVFILCNPGQSLYINLT